MLCITVSNCGTRVLMSHHGGTLEELSFARFVCGVNLVEHPLTLNAPGQQPPKLGLKHSSDCCSHASLQVKLQLPVQSEDSISSSASSGFRSIFDYMTFCPVSRETLHVKVYYTSSLMRAFIHITVLCMKRSDGLLLALFIHQASILKLQSATS